MLVALISHVEHYFSTFESTSCKFNGLIQLRKGFQNVISPESAFCNEVLSMSEKSKGSLLTAKNQSCVSCLQ